MAQRQTSLRWLLQGFSYELESTVRPRTVEYYCGEIGRFLRWVDAARVPSDIRLVTRHHIQAFFHYLITTCRGNGSVNEPVAIERLRWPYYRALRRFFGWAVKDEFIRWKDKWNKKKKESSFFNKIHESADKATIGAIAGGLIGFATAGPPGAILGVVFGGLIGPGVEFVRNLIRIAWKRPDTLSLRHHFLALGVEL
ncbi:MAG: phage integrase N-terminal SAM-like domain-containing protein [Dehalococcoidia bacterium]|nr:phage integrase N-terminal SAM-like domain-containing protein [Dehalococcoidia bacterium]